MLRLGIDLGGTKIEIVALDVSGHELMRRRVATPKDDYRGTLEAIAGLVADAEHELGARGTVGIGTLVFALGIGPAGEGSVWLLGLPARSGPDVGSRAG